MQKSVAHIIPFVFDKVKSHTCHLFLLLAFMLCVVTNIFASEEVLLQAIPKLQTSSQPKQHIYADSSHVEARFPDEASLSRFRDDPEFKYTDDFEYSKTFWEYIIHYISKFFNRLFGLDDSGKWINRIMIFLIVAIAVFVLAKLLRVDVSGLFFRKPEPFVDLVNTVIDENINTVNLNGMLEKALSGKEYRLAVRITYLIILKKLSDAGQIQWQPDKTNHSYLNEIKKQELHKSFAGLTHLYEYVWYGDFDITAEHYHHIEDDFNELNRLLR